MANFGYSIWEHLNNLNSKNYKCWNCGNIVASNKGYSSDNISTIFICPHCSAPSIIDELNKEYPDVIPGRSIKKLPKSVNQVFEESRNCIGAHAYTAAVMLLRKILMNLAVEEGAKEGDGFANYVKYLCDKGFIHIKQQKQAEEIKNLGNDANNKIETRTEEEAMKLLNLVTLILIYNYEQADVEEKSRD